MDSLRKKNILYANKNFSRFICHLIFSCSNKIEKNSDDCKRINISEKDFEKISFEQLPISLKETIIKLATVHKNIDTAFSLEKEIQYSYNNPGDGKGHMEQILNGKDMHIINGRCYDFLLYSKPYIIYDDKIFCLEQEPVYDCSVTPCKPEIASLKETIFYSLPLDKIFQEK